MRILDGSKCGAMSCSKRISLVILAFVLSVGTTAHATVTYLVEFEGPQGEPVSRGRHVVITDENVGLFTSAFDSTGDGLVDSVQFISEGEGDLLFLLLFDTSQIPGNLVQGIYQDAQRAPFAEAGHPGFWLAWNNVGGETISGSFTITEAEFGPNGPERFNAQFEQRFEDSPLALRGTFQYVDTTAIPEPGIASLIALGLGGLALLRRPASRLRASVTR